SKRIRHGHELGTPPVERSKVTRQRFGERARRLAVAAETCEIKLMQKGGVEGRQLLPLESVHHVTRRVREIERLELLRDGVEPAERAAVVVLVVALDELERKPVQQPGTAVDLLQCVPHVIASKRDDVWRRDARRRRTPALV